MVKLVEFLIDLRKAKSELDIDINILNKYIKQLEDKIKGQRKIMYSDLINLIAKEGYKGEDVNKLIRWCGNKIKNGYNFIDFY